MFKKYAIANVSKGLPELHLIFLSRKLGESLLLSSLLLPWNKDIGNPWSWRRNKEPCMNVLSGSYMDHLIHLPSHYFHKRVDACVPKLAREVFLQECSRELNKAFRCLTFRLIFRQFSTLSARTKKITKNRNPGATHV